MIKEVTIVKDFADDEYWLGLPEKIEFKNIYGTTYMVTMSMGDEHKAFYRPVMWGFADSIDEADQLASNFTSLLDYYRSTI
jgi:hypothetical protein